MKDEYNYGGVPAKLMPFVQKVMEQHCNGVAFRPVFPGKTDYALCTAGALERLKKALGVKE